MNIPYIIGLIIVFSFVIYFVVLVISKVREKVKPKTEEEKKKELENKSPSILGVANELLNDLRKSEWAKNYQEAQSKGKFTDMMPPELLGQTQDYSTKIPQDKKSKNKNDENPYATKL